MKNQAITITIELSSMDPIRQDLVGAIGDVITSYDDGRYPMETEVITAMLDRVINKASRQLINRDLQNSHGQEMVDVTPTTKSAKWYLESQKIPNPSIWVKSMSVMSVDWTDKNES